MNLEIIGHEDRYAVEQLMLSLFPEGSDGTVLSKLYRGKAYLSAVTEVTVEGKTNRDCRRLKISDECVRLRRQILQQSLYLAALPHLPQIPAWGALAGVRPTKLSTREMLAGGSRKDADRLLKNVYFVTPPRRELALDCSESTIKARSLLAPGDISLYVGIPFCPSRCTYCSFVSRTVGKKTELMTPYLDALISEIAETGRLLKESSHRVRTLYIGGGTPTTPTAKQLERLMGAIAENIDLSGCVEYTVEGGRPDTLNAEKLAVIAKMGANRMSINPQSMQDHVLRACGRPHDADAVVKSYHEAKAAGFDAINMDLIAGLPEDDYPGFCDSLEKVIALNPENITVHTLALKKGADLFEKRQSLPEDAEVARMVEYANTRLREAGYKPYYLYRQKYMSGSFENVGWSKNGKDCLYNIYMMEEVHSILSLGGGGMNKVNLPDGHLERFHNPKFPEQYIEQIDKVLQTKKELFTLL